ncbi:nitroreductase family protein [Candidatus Saccharibacteria bacterium]|nr:nitroreductase family protein [Candidatus Saccharibacteria bacterium]MBI3337945.1 nitroreductase family protein [Candidatus Saccharibacteria bacterium]
MSIETERLLPRHDNPHQLGRAVLDLIQSRRSLREGFIDKPIPTEVIDEIIQSGLRAPSSKNAQPWRVHVLERGERLAGIADTVQFAKNARDYAPIDPATGQLRQWESTVAESAQVLRAVGVGLFVENRGAFSGGRQSVANANNSVRGNGIVGYSFEMIGLGAMVENMWLSAHAQGLGGVFMGDVLVAEEEIQAELAFSGDLVGVLALGYTDLQPFEKALKADTVVYHDPSKGAL